MTKQVSKLAALFGKRLTWWFTVAWNLMFAVWIISGGLEVEGTYLVADARASTLPVIAGWAIGNAVVLAGWYIVSNRREVAR